MREVQVGYRVDGHESILPAVPPTVKPGQIGADARSQRFPALGPRQFEVFCRDDQSGFVLLEPGEYDGPASSRYSERLKSKPTFEYNGVIWRHFYNCLPDHALIVGWRRPSQYVNRGGD